VVCTSYPSLVPLVPDKFRDGHELVDPCECHHLRQVEPLDGEDCHLRRPVRHGAPDLLVRVGVDAHEVDVAGLRESVLQTYSVPIISPIISPLFPDGYLVLQYESSGAMGYQVALRVTA